jgi:Protein of unknown function (DUF1573)
MMRSRWFLCAALAATGILTCAQPLQAGETGSPADAPHVELAERDLKGGTVDPGTKVPFDFVVRNTGTAPLEILAVKPTCGCVVASFDRTIPPGGTGGIHAELNTISRQGEVRKNIDVTTNDPRSPHLVLTVRAIAREVLRVEPGFELLVPLDAGKIANQPATLRSLEGQRFRILSAESNVACVQAQPLESDAGTERHVRLTVLTSAPDRPFEALVTLKLDHAKIPEVILRLRGFPRQPIAARPERLYFGAVSDEAPVTRDLFLVRTDGPFRVLGVEIKDPRLSTKVVDMPGGKGCDLIVTYRGGGKRGPVKGAITIRTDDPHYPRIVVPFTAEVS